MTTNLADQAATIPVEEHTVNKIQKGKTIPGSVSYTHLDVYKRQSLEIHLKTIINCVKKWTETGRKTCDKKCKLTWK